MSSDMADVLASKHLQDAVLDSPDVSLFLDELCRHAASSLGNEDRLFCGVTLLRDRKAATAGSSGTRAREMDEVQYNFDTGPCLSAAREHITVCLTDLSRESRWPEFITAVASHGVQSILAVPFNLVGDAKAALNLYSTDAYDFTDPDIARATLYAEEASRSLRLAIRIANLGETAQNLNSAMESRTAIDIAIGIIMSQNRCTQAEAFTFLQKASSHRNIKLRDLAGQIVAAHGASPEPTTHFDH